MYVMYWESLHFIQKIFDNKHHNYARIDENTEMRTIAKTVYMGQVDDAPENNMHINSGK